MQTILEVFYLRIMGKQVYYQRKQTNMSRKGGDPKRMIRGNLSDEEILERLLSLNLERSKG